ncbi:hypothetical protein R1sor_023206 [Riccia sorocarpa]|uniref:Uncharacterized protein n=1 Tax=Riccia sorocarpa TaxID=122646 RepID=A0ABD3GM00_9MARC
MTTKVEMEQERRRHRISALAAHRRRPMSGLCRRNRHKKKTDSHDRRVAAVRLRRNRGFTLMQTFAVAVHGVSAAGRS